MKRGKIVPPPAPASPAAPTVATPLPGDAPAGTVARQTDPPSPPDSDRAGTEAAVAAWRNEGDPN